MKKCEKIHEIKYIIYKVDQYNKAKFYQYFPVKLS